MILGPFFEFGQVSIFLTPFSKKWEPLTSQISLLLILGFSLPYDEKNIPLFFK
jgi:hypothetical protein